MKRKWSSDPEEAIPFGGNLSRVSYITQHFRAVYQNMNCRTTLFVTLCRPIFPSIGHAEEQQNFQLEELCSVTNEQCLCPGDSTPDLQYMPDVLCACHGLQFRHLIDATFTSSRFVSRPIIMVLV